MPDIPLKIYKVGGSSYDIGMGDRGTGIDPQELYQAYHSNPKVKQQIDFEIARRERDEPLIAKAYRQVISGNFGSFETPYATDPVTGKPSLKTSLAQEAANKSGVASGTLQEVKIGTGTGYVPPGTFVPPPATGGAPSSGTPSSPSPITPPPANSAFKGSEAYKALSKDEQDLVDLAFSSFSGTPEQQKIFADALEQAQALADPYARTQMILARGEFESKIAYLQGDLERASEVIKRTRDQISEDVTSGKEFLSLEQQAEIAREKTNYDGDLLNIADQAAEKGLTFATGARSRALAEDRRTTQYQDVIQSSQRQYNFKKKELELKAARGDIDAQKQLQDIQKKSEFNLESIGRSAEKVLGTANLPGGSGYTATGGVLGDIEQDRRKSIIEAARLGLPAIT